MRLWLLDCDGSSAVTVDEIVVCVAIGLGTVEPETCSGCDSSADRRVTVDEIVAAIDGALSGCPAVATVTPSPTASETTTPSPLATPTPTESATTTATPASMPSDLNIVISGNAVRLTWTAPEPTSGNTEVVVLRRLNVPASGPHDPEAAIVYRGPANEATDDLIHLLPDLPESPREYFYSIYGCHSVAVCDEDGPRVALEPSLVDVLKRGGYVIHWRHASADVCSDDQHLGNAEITRVPNWWKSCDDDCSTAHARQLNATGVAESIEIGRQLRARAIQFGRVLTSEYCRNFETAELMDLGPEIEHVEALTYFVYDEDQRCSRTYDLIGQVPAEGTSTALIGHVGYPVVCPNLSNLLWGEAAIFKPDGSGGAEFITRLHADEWAALEPAM